MIALGETVQRYVTELIGTFFLVLTIGATVLGEVALAPLAIGAVLMTQVYAGGHISGAHYNPAVTLAAFLRGALPAKDVLPYWISQVTGAVLGSMAALYVVAPTALASPQAVPGSRIGVVLLAEFLFTFALAWVVLNAATSKDNDGNSFYGLAIGFTVAAGAFAVGGISGGVFNPAVAVAASLMGLMSWTSIWIYLVATLSAGAAAAFVFRACSPADVAPQPAPAAEAALAH